MSSRDYYNFKRKCDSIERRARKSQESGELPKWVKRILDFIKSNQ